jgi:ADP-ribosylglycohydrolase
MKGGDTDTNAAIVGGLIGAWQGISQIPQEWTIKILNFRSVAQPG